MIVGTSESRECCPCSLPSSFAVQLSPRLVTLASRDVLGLRSVLHICSYTLHADELDELRFGFLEPISLDASWVDLSPCKDGKLWFNLTCTK